jgi:hypothetical protein
MSKELLAEIEALESRLAAEDEEVEQEVKATEDEDLEKEIKALEEELDEEVVEEKKAEEVEEDDLDKEIKALEEEIDGEDEEDALIASIFAGEAEDIAKSNKELENEAAKYDKEDGLVSEAEKINKEDVKTMKESAGSPKADVGDFGNEDQNTKMSSQRKAAVKNPFEDRGLIWQDNAAVEELLKKDLTDDDGEPITLLNTGVKKSDFIYASNLKEASMRLDNVASALQERGGNWVKIAARLDMIANSIDSKRKIVASKIASELIK